MTFALHRAECLGWMRGQPPRSFHAVVADPPFTPLEFDAGNVAKLRAGRGGVWRQPPRIGGNRRAPLPRYTVVTPEDERRMRAFMAEWYVEVARLLVPGGHAFVAASTATERLIFSPADGSGLERRGVVARLVRTLRGGDKPKGAEGEFPDVCTTPRAAWEPWAVLRAPLSERTVAQNLRRHGAGALRRLADGRPFCDVIPCAPAGKKERALSPHPSLKPQRFVRRIVRAALPLGRGLVLDPFAGGGSTLAAAERLGADSVGVEMDEVFCAMARAGVPALARFDDDDETETTEG